MNECCRLANDKAGGYKVFKFDKVFNEQAD